MKTVELVKSEDFGIEKSKANELIGNLPQILEERNELQKQFDEVVRLNIENPETSLKAKKLRLLIQKNRTQGINVWHKTTKDFFLKGGQFVDAIKRKEVAVNERMESTLEEIEKYFENKEKERLEKLQNERAEILSKYVEDAHERDLASMDEDVWSAYLDAKKKAWEDEQEAIRKAEEERIAREKAEEEERQRIRLENERLKKEADERERQAKIEAQKRAQEEAKRQAELEAERKAREEKERKEREIYEAKLKAEREEKERIQKELEAKAEAERKAQEEAERKAEEELKKGDSEKLQDLRNELVNIYNKFDFKAKANIEKYEKVKSILNQAINIL